MLTQAQAAPGAGLDAFFKADGVAVIGASDDITKIGGRPVQLLPVTMALAREIAAKAPLAIMYAKRAANMVDVMPQRDAYRFEQEFTVALSKTEDAREARMAFLEKRAPVFKGR